MTPDNTHVMDIEGILDYIIYLHNKALREVGENHNHDYMAGKAYAYGDIRTILCSWLRPNDKFLKFIVESDE